MINRRSEQKRQYNRAPHWRFKMTAEPIEWTDLVRGPVKFDGTLISDPVLIREDGSPLYHLCSVIDDVDYDITHVVRGEDHVSNTAMHIQMFKAMGRKPPEFAHLPMISRTPRAASSRSGSARCPCATCRQNEGLEPMALISLLSRLGSSDPIEPFTRLQPLIESFDLSRFSKGAPKFDMEELLRLNTKIIHAAPFDDVKVRLAQMGLEDLNENPLAVGAREPDQAVGHQRVVARRQRPG